MVRISNGLISLLNMVTLILSVAIIGASAYLYMHENASDCQRFLQLPLLILGGILLITSFLGFAGSCCNVSEFLCFYLFVMSLLIAGLFCFTIFAFVVTNKGVGQVVSGRGYKEYRLGHYSNWLQNHIVNSGNWAKIRSCLVEAHVCRSLGADVPQNAADFYKRNLNSVQSGCCKPPTYCGCTYINATFWEKPKSGPVDPDTDCETWSNLQDTLCYDCKSCKAGVLHNVKRDWKKLAIVNISVIIFLMVIHCIGSCAYRNSRTRQYSRYRGY